MKSRQLSRFARLTPPHLTTFSRVSVALAMPALAFLLCEWLFDLLSPSFEAPFIAAVAVTAWVCGPQFGLAATALSAAALSYFFLPPLNSFVIRDANTATKLVIFLGASLLFNLLVWRIYRTQADLSYSEERYRSLAELIPFGAWISDPQGNMQHLSDTFLASFHVTMQDCAGLGWIDLIDEQQREEVLADWQECMRNGYFWDYEYRMTARDGATYVVLSRGVPLHDAAGQIRSWVGMHLDITERERLAEQRVLQARDIARFNAELEQFAYISAHDLQEPLRMITSYVQLLQKKYKDTLGKDGQTYVAYAVEGATRLQTLLQDLMLLQRIGKNPDQRNVCELDRIAEKAWSNLQDKVAATGARLETSGLPAVLCNEREMIELFENLFDNGIKYREADRLPVVRVSATRDRDTWTVNVSDNGIGIEQQYLKRIFDVFQRLHPRTLYPGTGIGLSICKKVVEVHGGSIWAESEPGSGATFRFTIPANAGTGPHIRSADLAEARPARAAQPDEDPFRTAR